MFWAFFAKSQLDSLEFIVRMCVFVDFPTFELFLPNWSLVRWNPTWKDVFPMILNDFHIFQRSRAHWKLISLTSLQKHISNDFQTILAMFNLIGAWFTKLYLIRAQSQPSRHHRSKIWKDTYSEDYRRAGCHMKTTNQCFKPWISDYRTNEGEGMHNKTPRLLH